MLSTLSHPPKDNHLLTSDTEYGIDDTGEVPSPAFVEKATPRDAINNPVKNSKYPIIVSTTVIEVGLDVKTANLMIIYDASSFGLASLHQLRGRIGRDGKKANCLLIYDGHDEEERNKLKVLVDSNDGFYIANEDLKRRGPGELGGYRQSGLPSFNFVNIVNDFKIFTCARDDAKFILQNRLEPSFRKLIDLAKKEISSDKFTNV